MTPPQGQALRVTCAFGSASCKDPRGCCHSPVTAVSLIHLAVVTCQPAARDHEGRVANPRLPRAAGRELSGPPVTQTGAIVAFATVPL
eukprot:3086726-Prymnesium_polylepis.1